MSIKRFPTDVTAAQIRSLSPEPPTAVVADLIEEVRRGGDTALAQIERRFGAEHSIDPISQDEIAAAVASIDPDLRSAIELAIENVQVVAERQLATDFAVELPQGQTVDYRYLPVRRAGAYVPGGRGSYPSTAIMCLATARAAGVESIAVVSPVREDGKVDPAVLLVCSLLGVTEIHPTGGAQAVAALALGTETIEPVDVLVGPGSSYVQEAKRQLAGEIGIDGIAGPSELVVVADSTADPGAIALDLLAQGEHGPDSLVLLISPDPDLLDAVAGRCSEISAVMAVVLASDMSAAVQLADDIAPEHMQLIGNHENELAKQVRNAGCLFLGANAATAFGDYVAGSNHVLPTGGAARFTSALSVSTFVRRMATVRIPDEAVGELSRAGASIARAEGFIRHAESMEKRADK